MNCIEANQSCLRLRAAFLKSSVSYRAGRCADEEVVRRPSRSTLSRVVLLVFSGFFLLATSEDEPWVSSQEVEESLNMTRESAAQIQFDQTVTGTDVGPDFRIRYEVPGADHDDVIVDVLGEDPENVSVTGSYVSCRRCGDSISVRFSLAPGSDIDFGTVFLTARSEIYADEWKEIEGVVLDLKTAALEDAAEVIVLAESTLGDGHRAWELIASPNVELEARNNPSIDIYGVGDEPDQLVSGERMTLDHCSGCPETPIYMWSRPYGAVAWRVVTINPEAVATTRPLSLSTAEASANTQGLAISSGQTIRFDVTVSIDGESAAIPPSVSLRLGTNLESGPYPRGSVKAVGPAEVPTQNRPLMQATPSGWELIFAVEWSANDDNIDSFETQFGATLEWIDELTPLDVQSVRIDVSEQR